MDIIEQIKDFVKTGEVSGEYGWVGVTWEDVADHFNGEIVKNEIVDSTRWNVISEIVMKFDNEYVRVLHADGATEMQENTRAVDELHALTLVKPREVTTVIYEPVNPPEKTIARPVDETFEW